MKKVKSENAEAAIKFLCKQDEEFGAKIQEMSVVRAVSSILKTGGFDLDKLHSDGDMRIIIDTFI